VPPEVYAPAPIPTTYAGGATNGVAMNVPSAILLPSITAAVNKAAAEIPAGKTGALVTIFTPKGANLAVVQKIGNNVKVTAWIGKEWGPKTGDPAWSYGCAATVVW